MKEAKILFLGLAISSLLFAQSTFEVASVKPSAPDAQGMFIRPLAGGGLQITGASLKNLVSLAYSVRAFQIIGGGDWVEKDRFDIDARASAPASPGEEQRTLLERTRNLLAERFQLVLHSETREQPVYEMVVAKGGPKLQPATDERSLIRKLGRGTLKGNAVQLGMLALNLSNELGRRVIDQTRLTGRYTFELTWTPAPSAEAPPGPAAQSVDLPPSGGTEGPSIFTALTEQLGLRLESKKGPVEVLVVDRAERPSKN